MGQLVGISQVSLFLNFLPKSALVIHVSNIHGFASHFPYSSQMATTFLRNSSSLMKMYMFSVVLFTTDCIAVDVLNSLQLVEEIQ